jgi:hypothetical protein
VRGQPEGVTMMAGRCRDLGTSAIHGKSLERVWGEWGDGDYGSRAKETESIMPGEMHFLNPLASVKLLAVCPTK